MIPFTVNAQWQRLTHVLLGKSYPPEFYDYISDIEIRRVFQQIARETEEDFQKLIRVFDQFNIKYYRPEIKYDHTFYTNFGRIIPPPMTPCDYTCMVGSTLIIDPQIRYWKPIFVEHGTHSGSDITGDGKDPDRWDELTDSEQQDLIRCGANPFWQTALDDILASGTELLSMDLINSSQTVRAGRDLITGTQEDEMSDAEISKKQLYLDRMLPEFRHHIALTHGHRDSVYCPVKPGLIVGIFDGSTYGHSFPGWEVCDVPTTTWDAVAPFMYLKEKNKGKWWVPGEELNTAFTEFVETWMHQWVGYVEQTVFDVNMLVIDEHNVVVNNYNEKVFDAFARHDITPHIVNLRHRFFWDGGLHCVTSDVNRDGPLEDYF